MMPHMIREAFGAEARQLSRVLAGLDDAAFARPTACAPWTVAELVYHVRMTMGRLPGMLAAPEPAGPDLVSAAGYFRVDRRFSTAANAGRIQSAQRGAAALDREPWVTVQAAHVSEDLLLPAAAAGRLRAETGWDRVGLIARLTGRHPVTPSETDLIKAAGAGRLALG